ncbi:MAG: hypothetical protein ACRCV7_02225, partial [Culicoidibacterales bacterium]
NKLPEFSQNIKGFEYDLATGSMFKIDNTGMKTKLEGTHMTTMIASLLESVKGDNSADVSKDYIDYIPSGSFVDAVNVGLNAKPASLVSGQTLEIIVTATDGKISPASAKPAGAIKVSKTYEVKITGQKAVVDNKVETNKKTETAMLPDTSGTQQGNIMGMFVMIFSSGIISLILRKKFTVK